MTTDDADDEVTAADRAALELAIEVTRNESPARRKQIDEFLLERPWFQVAAFCGGCAQSRALRLMPWQPAPCSVDIASALQIADPQRGYRRGGTVAATHAAVRCQQVASRSC